MDAQTFLDTLYLGDRACKGITIDGWASTVRVQIDCVSRVRDPSETWNFYTAEDIRDAALVFGGVVAVSLEGEGIPNDLINSIEVVAVVGDVATVELSIDSVNAEAVHHEMLLRVRCTAIWLEDPTNPGIRIER
jgi:hypothetical protein